MVEIEAWVTHCIHLHVGCRRVLPRRPASSVCLISDDHFRLPSTGSVRRSSPVASSTAHMLAATILTRRIRSTWPSSTLRSSLREACMVVGSDTQLVLTEHSFRNSLCRNRCVDDKAHRKQKALDREGCVGIRTHDRPKLLVPVTARSASGSGGQRLSTPSLQPQLTCLVLDSRST